MLAKSVLFLSILSSRVVFHKACPQKLCNLMIKIERYLLPSAFVVISQLDNGTDHIEKAIEQCYYHGHLGNPERTAVAVDTCNGLKGIIQDDNGEEYFIEPHVLYKTSSEYHNKHVLYKTKDLKIKKQGMCGKENFHRLKHYRNYDVQAQFYDYINSINNVISIFPLKFQILVVSAIFPLWNLYQQDGPKKEKIICAGINKSINLGFGCTK
ncbi:zinc metalloproteinase-disintegrin-like EoMP06 [Hydractinia symbiolongicarpus]|uniref:zinc metalloproteinase-disintegrin-like EoMP06 n=1 Tax=Hydractinia symbiolongicarpus TaxID=13093 RepID=UPI00254B4986|nr:zinc metalloproteinase-disintegrin-like EoMP06 [Hydractinia symbiolongicarpus]